MNIYAASIGVLVFLFLAYCVSANNIFVYGCIITTIVIKCIGCASRKSYYIMHKGHTCMRKPHIHYNKIGGASQQYDYYQYINAHTDVPTFVLPNPIEYKDYTYNSTSGYINVDNIDCAFIRKSNKENTTHAYYIEYARTNLANTTPVANSKVQKNVEIHGEPFCDLLHDNDNDMDALFTNHVLDKTFPKVVDMEYTYVDADIHSRHPDSNRLAFNTAISTDKGAAVTVQNSKGKMRYNTMNKTLTITDSIFGERTTNIVQECGTAGDHPNIYDILKEYITNGNTSLTHIEMMACIHAVNTNAVFTSFAIAQGVIGERMRALPNTVFCLPSQLNAAEYVSENRIVEILSSYLYDGTGGPAGQLAGDPGVAQFIIYNAENKNSNGMGINNVRELLEQVNKVDAVKQLILQNGYLLLQESGQIHKNMNIDVGDDICKAFGENLNLMKLLIAQNVMMCGINRTVATMEHKVDIAYASAMPYNNYHTQRCDVTNEYVRETQKNSRILAILVIYGQINLLLQYAKACSKNVVILPLGGGVFSNIRSDILLAILLASANQQLIDRVIPKIELLCYTPDEYDVYNGYYNTTGTPAGVPVVQKSAEGTNHRSTTTASDVYHIMMGDADFSIKLAEIYHIVYVNTPDLNKIMGSAGHHVAVVKLCKDVWAVFNETKTNSNRFVTKPTYYILKNYNNNNNNKTMVENIKEKHKDIDALCYVSISGAPTSQSNTYKYTINNAGDINKKQPPRTHQMLAYLLTDGYIELTIPYSNDTGELAYIPLDKQKNLDIIYKYNRRTMTDTNTNKSVVFLLPANHYLKESAPFTISALTTNTTLVPGVLASLNGGKIGSTQRSNRFADGLS